MMQVVVISKIEYLEDGTSVNVHGVYRDLKEFYDEARTNGYKFDSNTKEYYTTDMYGNDTYYEESVHSVIGDL